MADRRDAARASFEAALAINRDTARAHSSLGALAADAGRRDEAFEHWRRAVDADPRELETLLGVGASLVGRTDDGGPPQPRVLSQRRAAGRGRKRSSGHLGVARRRAVTRRRRMRAGLPPVAPAAGYLSKVSPDP
jgi:tetratricopeptide (TPR) repeat protein